MDLNYKRIVIKVGSNVLTQANGLPDLHRIEHLVEQIAAIKKQNKEVILVSSGAVAFGRSLLSVSDKCDAVATRQLFASIGQVKLINTYSDLFKKQNLVCAQVLVTKEDFRDRLHYLNMKNCFDILIQHNVVPVINENDVISVTELMFTDNDELAGLIASLLNADALIILSNVDGIFNGDPKNPDSKVIEHIDPDFNNFSEFISAKKSQFGRGGMITKSSMAHKISGLGIAVHIANGSTENVIAKVLKEKVINTRFAPQKIASGKKKWIANSENYVTGVVRINDGAKLALTSSKASSLLPVGLIGIEKDFKKGDIIRLIDQDNLAIGLGIAEYNSEKAKERVGLKNQKALVHYDYLFLTH
ncbi:Glutamate 5-kinase [Arcticibacter svalbardensis MN12-7]|uniref:Glutamate 5-kinase n=1 Tax=Arcticibacter svalbardensis MN12-7 TaxID=1150600 RepID=R9GPQ2_9SPHI|nr:glutamate 5-kinase [Arcticibacter svalbardensis]EOR93681.1 Glutamate 5-kinase [Arcticibacter svalbardensis MN12-7]